MLKLIFQQWKFALHNITVLVCLIFNNQEKYIAIFTCDARTGRKTGRQASKLLSAVREDNNSCLVSAHLSIVAHYLLLRTTEIDKLPITGYSTIVYL